MFTSCVNFSYNEKIKLLMIDKEIVKIKTISNSNTSEVMLTELKPSNKPRFEENTNTIL